MTAFDQKITSTVFGHSLEKNIWQQRQKKKGCENFHRPLTHVQLFLIDKHAEHSVEYEGSPTTENKRHFDLK